MLACRRPRTPTLLQKLHCQLDPDESQVERDCKAKAKGISREDTRFASCAQPRTPCLGRLLWNTTSFVFVDIRSPTTGLTAALARSPIQTSKNPAAFGASAKHSRRKKLLAPASRSPKRLTSLSTQIFRIYPDIFSSSRYPRILVSSLHGRGVRSAHLASSWR
jgi:hypothetical protein